MIEEETLHIQIINGTIVDVVDLDVVPVAKDYAVIVAPIHVDAHADIF